MAKGARFEDRWTWERDAHEDWLEAIKDNWPRAYAVIETARLTYGDDMGAYPCWLGVRLMEMHRVLKPTGSLYLHIDHTAHAYAKCLLDGISGKGVSRMKSSGSGHPATTAQSDGVLSTIPCCSTRGAKPIRGIASRNRTPLTT